MPYCDVLRGERLRERDDAALRRRVGRLDRAHQAEVGGHVDDRAAARLDEVRYAVAAGQERMQQVERDGAVPDVEIHLVHRHVFLQRAAGAVEDDVEPAEAARPSPRPRASRSRPASRPSRRRAPRRPPRGSRARRAPRARASISMIATFAPSLTKSFAVAFAMPAPAPVRNATLPVSFAHCGILATPSKQRREW